MCILGEIVMSEMSLEELPGVGPATAEKLKEAGFNTIEAVAVASPSELATTADIGESTAAKIINAEEKMLISKLTRSAPVASVEVAKKHITKTLEHNPNLHEQYINQSIDSLDRLNF